jgi:Domain of unknown function (DUF4153)
MFLSPGFLIQAFFDAFRRFPAVMLCALVGVINFIILIETEDNANALHQRIWMACQLGLPLLTGTVAWAESERLPQKWSWLLQGAGMVALVLYASSLDVKLDIFNYVQLPRFLLLLLSAHLLVAVAPYFSRSEVRDFWEYNRQLFALFCLGAFYAAIIFVGLAVAILAADQLFNLEIRDKIYVKLFSVVGGIFVTSFFLYNFPKNYTSHTPASALVAGSRTLTKFILIPIVFIYFLILYVYGGKLLAEWELPRGWIGKLVTGFSVAGILTYLLNFMVPAEGERSINGWFKRYFWWVLLPLSGLLMLSVYRRISDYGVTEPRYLLAHIGAWLLFNCLYFLVSKRDNIQFIPISLLVFTLFAGFVPYFNMFDTSVRAQSRELKTLLQQYQCFDNTGKLQPCDESSDTTLTTNLGRFDDMLHFLGDRAQLAVLPELTPFLTNKQEQRLVADSIYNWLLPKHQKSIYYNSANYITFSSQPDFWDVINIEPYRQLSMIRLYDEVKTDKSKRLDFSNNQVVDESREIAFSLLPIENLVKQYQEQSNQVENYIYLQREEAEIELLSTNKKHKALLLINTIRTEKRLNRWIVVELDGYWLE